MARTLIKNGTVISPAGVEPADVLIDGETIASVGAPGFFADAEPGCEKVIDATGKHVVPGGIDVHTHMELPFGGTFAKDTFETGTRAAAFGGTTTVVVPPKAAARVPVSNVSLANVPPNGSSMWVWTSIPPGMT